MQLTWATVIAACAFALSSYTLALRMKQDRLGAFFKAQEYLLSADLQAARSIVYAAARAGRLPSSDADYAAVIRAFGLFDSVAQMTRRRVFPEEWLLDSWHHHLQQMRVVYESVLRERLEWQSYNPWADLGWLMDRAEHFRSRRECCTRPLRDRVAAYEGSFLSGRSEH